MKTNCDTCPFKTTNLAGYLFVCFSSLNQDDPGADKENSVLPPGGVAPSVKASEENMIDNPYLRPVKKPKVRRKK